MKGGPIGGRTNSPQRSSIAFVSQRRVLSKSPDFLLQIASSIQRRDRQICIHLFNHKVLTTHHIQDLFFENDRVCRRRLAKLTEFGLVVPFRPQASRGSYPNHFILGDLGLYLVAAEFGVEVKELGLKKDRLTRLAFSSQLDHVLAINSFMCSLTATFRHDQDDHRVVRWFGERQSARKWGEHLMFPDAEVVFHAHSEYRNLFLEMDMGTENLKRLEAKLPRYSFVYRHKDSIAHHLLFCFQSAAREASARRVLGWPLPIATAVYGRHMADPSGPNWLQIRSEDRVRLCELPLIQKGELSK